MTWEPVVDLDGDLWIGLVDDSQVYVGSFERPIRRVDPRRPTALLPLLERPYDAVVAEIEGAGDVAGHVPLIAIPAAAVASENDEWARLALSWLADMPPSPDIRQLLVELEEASWTADETRHGARRVRRALYGVGG